MTARLSTTCAFATFVSFCLVLLLISCGSDPVSPDSGASKITEHSPALSFDHERLLFVRDEAGDTAGSGIYFADIGTPVRLQAVSGIKLSSPSFSPDNKRLMYLDNGVIRVRNLETDSSSVFMRYFRFDAVCWLTNDLFVAELNQRIWIARWPDEGSFTFWTNGYDPSVIRQQEIIYAGAASPGKTNILRRDLSGINAGEPSAKVASISPVRYPTVTPVDDEYLFAIDLGAGFDIVLQKGTDSYRALASSSMPRALFIDSTRFVYTGPDGWLWTFDTTDSTTKRFDLRGGRPTD